MKNKKPDNKSDDDFKSMDDSLDNIRKIILANKDAEGEPDSVLNRDIVPTESIEDVGDSFVDQPKEQMDLFPKPHQGLVFNGRNLELISHKMFPHSRAQDVGSHVRIIELGEDARIRIKIVPSSGFYTHKVQETFLACMKHWQNNANLEGRARLTFSEVCRIKGITPTGDNIRNAKRHMDILYDTVQDWTKSYDVDGTPSNLKKFRFLYDYEYTDGNRRGDTTNFDKEFYIEFHPLITADLLKGRINPVAYSSILSIKNEMAASWFKYTDTRICQNKKGQIGAKKLVDHLMLSPTRYKKLSKRKEIVTTLVKHCHGVELSNGQTYQCKASLTRDGTDYKLKEWVVGSAVKFKARKGAKVVNKDSEMVEYLATHIFDVVGDNQNMKWYRYIARHCSQSLVFRAVSEYKEATRTTKPKVPGAYFTGVLHVILHSSGKEWIASDCDKDCKHLPQNRLLH